MLNISSFSCAGRKGHNEDSILMEQLDNDRILLAVADGMGGHIGGEIASNLAINTVKDELIAKPNITLSNVFKSVQQAFIKKAELEPSLKKMGTTLTVCDINSNKVSIAHIGDTRLYHLRNGGILSQTKDQTEVQKLLDENILTKNRAKNYHRKNILLSVMSAYRDYEIQLKTFYLTDGDRLVLLSDGAYSLISKREIRDLSLANNNIKNFVYSIKSVIESRDIKDDYTAIGFEYKNTT